MISTIWAALLVFSVTSFSVLSLFIILKGFGELKDILRALNRPAESGMADITPKEAEKARHRTD